MQKKISKIQKKLNTISSNFKEFYRQEQYLNAYNEATKAHLLTPKSLEPLSDMATCLVRLKMHQKAISVSKKILKINPNYINALDAISHSAYAINDLSLVREYGSKALILRDKQIKENPSFNTQFLQKGKKIISFSLFENLPKYCETAVINAQIAKHIYPEWICRFYVDESVPTHVIRRLKQNNSEIYFADDEMKKIPRTMWRFLVLNDNDVSFAIFRDTDSIISKKEAKCVHEWINSDKCFHIIRDAGSHTELILAGTWGARCGIIDNLNLLIKDYLSKPLESQRFADQFFLRKYIWAYARQSLLSHDNCFSFLSPKPIFESEFEKKNRHSIGANEARFEFHAQTNFPENSKVRWSFYSKINPLINDDFTVNTNEEKLICQYETKVKNNQVSSFFPDIYINGFKDKLSRLSVEKISED